MSKKLIEIWRSIGIKAGESDRWMAVEDTLKGTLRSCRSRRCTWITGPTALVWADIAEWETTAHFHLLYGVKMAEDTKEDYALFCAIKAEFWKGYIVGRMETGIDLYAIAQGLEMVGYEEEWKKRAKT